MQGKRDTTEETIRPLREADAGNQVEVALIRLLFQKLA